MARIKEQRWSSFKGGAKRKSKLSPFYFSFLKHLCVRCHPRVSSEIRACACILLNLVFCFSSKLESAYSLVLMTLQIYEHDWFIWHNSRVKNCKWPTKSINLISYQCFEKWRCNIWTKYLAINSNPCLNKSNEILPNPFLTARFMSSTISSHVYVYGCLIR